MGLQNLTCCNVPVRVRQSGVEGNRRCHRAARLAEGLTRCSAAPPLLVGEGDSEDGGQEKFSKSEEKDSRVERLERNVSGTTTDEY